MIAERFTVIDAEQRSAEWFAARLGRVTGSRAGDMLLTTKKGGWTAARGDYRLELVCERLTGVPQKSDYVSNDMRRGTDKEPDAFAAYEILTGQIVQRSGFLSHTSLMAGCSLDGHVGNFDGIVEVKCPKPTTHVQYIRDGKVPAEYVPQVTHNLWMTRAPFCDFVSWCDVFPPELQLFRVRVYTKDVDLVAYELALSLFLSEVEKECDSVKALAQTGAAA